MANRQKGQPQPVFANLTPPAPGGRWDDSGFLYQTPDGQWWAPPRQNNSHTGGATNNASATEWKPHKPPESAMHAFVTKGLPILTAGIAAPMLAGAMAGGAGGAAAGAGGATAGGATTAATAGGLTLAKTLPVLQAAGSMAANASAARSQNRAAQQNNNIAQNNAELTRAQVAGQQINTDLQQRKYLDDMYQSRAHDARLGGLLQGMRDVSISSPSQIPRSTISGGLRPSAMVGAADIGKAMQQRAMAELLNPTKPGGIQGADGTVQDNGRLPSQPYLTPLSPMPTGNAADTTLNLIDLFGAGAGLSEDLLKNRPRPYVPPQQTPQYSPGLMNGVHF